MGRNTFIVHLLCCVLVVLASGCTQAGRSYRTQLQDASRRAEVFDFNSLRAELVWSAVHVSDAMRDARLKREAELRHMTPQETRRFIPKLWHAHGTVFYVGFFAPRDAKALEASDAYWRVELKDSQGRVHRATRLEQTPISPLDRKLFPDLDYWSKAYFVVFPQEFEPPFSLTLYGLNATSTLQWP